MTSPDSGRVRSRREGFRRRPAALSSPYPVSECLHRLAAVTMSRGPTTWYLSARSAGLPDPRFRGEVHQSRIILSRFNTGRGSYFAVLDARLGPKADGGTRLTGQIGLAPGTAKLLPVLTGAFALASLGLLATGVVQLALGHIAGLAPTAEFPLPVAVAAGFHVLGRRSLERDISRLLAQVGEVLGSTAVSPGPLAASGDAIAEQLGENVIPQD